MKKIAVLVLNYNGKKYLKKCFNSLLCQTSKDLDIFLVDNNSTDGSREFTIKNYDCVKIINTGDNLGFTGAYNFVCRYLDKKKGRYSYYLLLNNDTESDRYLIEKITGVLDKNKEVGIIMPTVVDGNMKIDIKGGRFLFWTGTTLGEKRRVDFVRGNSLHKCFWASGCALAIRSSLFKQLGYFHDYFMYYEDVDISWRVNNYGMAVVSTDATFVKHLQGGSRLPSSFQVFLCEKNRILNYWQNLPNLLFFLYLPLLLLLRMVLLVSDVRHPRNLVARFKGLSLGLFLLSKFKKRTYSLKRHLQVIRGMNKITIHNRL
ncbi:MAG: glycosyltransferase family 2 protein [Patescibacteria group bacterium]